MQDSVSFAGFGQPAETPRGRVASQLASFKPRDWYLRSSRKRALDLAIAACALVLLSPIMLIIASLIKISGGRGPVLYKQTRSGIDGQWFVMWKFRTMRVEQSAKFKQAERTDSRVTPIGAVLRSTSLDELPQLFNVLTGQMSIVGPRPHPVDLDRLYFDKVEGYAQRLNAKPGITGLAQISGARGPTPDTASMADRIAKDLEYLSSASLFTDFKIMVMTGKEVISSPTAF